ncbi:MAG: hypothetical protein NZ602_03270 [Thermoguttaceae bacterium]|nr:hypothetical protein [Thermoguttaceae bacterium]MDW8037911.1 hypothetical protein [Thermoguttaceae bacterium]
MLWIAAVGLTISAAGQLVFAGVVLTALLVWGKPPPVLSVVLSAQEIERLDPTLLAATRTLAIYFQSTLASLALLKLAVIWGALVRQEHWALWALGGAILVSQTGAFFADAAIGHRSLPLNIFLATVQIVMWALAAGGIYFPGKPAG